jgi:hypothetical protein
MNATTQTIAFLRTLTLDGFLTSDEVWALAKFFNENPECMQCWPGEILVPMLHSAFDDAQLAEEEMQALADTISSIEEEWLGRSGPPAPAETEVAVEVAALPALMPVIEQRIEVPAHREDTSYVVALRDHSCTCPDWTQRKQHPPRHPGRCCRHMAYAFTRSGKVFEPWFQALLDDCFAKARGTPPGGDWMLLELLPRKPVVLAGGNGQWCTVYSPGANGYESFAFNSVQNRWSYGEAPTKASLIERAIRESFAAAQA